VKAAIDLVRNVLLREEFSLRKAQKNPAESQQLKELRQGFAILEAAESVDKENAIDYFLEGMSQGRDHVEVMSPYREDHNIKNFDRARDEITALLESLPNKEPK
jgi:hypothetical protein